MITTPICENHSVLAGGMLALRVCALLKDLSQEINFNVAHELLIRHALCMSFIVPSKLATAAYINSVPSAIRYDKSTKKSRA